MRRLTPRGPLTVPFDLTDAGLAVTVGPLGAQLIALTTYFRAYNATVVDRAPCASRDCSVYSSDAYVVAGSEGACLTPTAAASAGEPTVPLSLWFNGVLDNMAAPTPPVDGQHWQRVDDECTAYAGDAPGRWPLEVWHNPDVSDYWTLASPTSRAAAVAAGYTRVQALGYVASELPPPPDEVEAYAYVLRVEWSS